MPFPFWRTVPRSRDPTWRIVFCLIIVLIIVGALFGFFAILSWALGCANISDCIDRMGFGEIFARMPWLGVLCGVFIVLAIVMAFIGMLFWRGIMERDGWGRPKHVRNRHPPEQDSDDGHRGNDDLEDGRRR